MEVIDEYKACESPDYFSYGAEIDLQRSSRDQKSEM